MSPAPSQSEPVRIGECRYLKPLSLKNLCIAKESSDLMRKSAPYLFVRGLKWAISLRYSSVWRFFWRG